MTLPRTADVAVVGLGGIGSAACLALAQRGYRVVGVEQFGRAHDRGSSHGETRLFRARHSQPHRRRLAEQASAGWRSLEASQGRELFRDTGQLWVGPEAVALAAGFDRIESADLQRLGFRMPNAAVSCFWDPTGACLAVEACVDAACAGAEAAGAQLSFRTRTRGFSRRNDGFTVHTDHGQVFASEVVVAAGAWARALVPGLRLRTYQVPQVWFATSQPRQLSPFVFDLPDGDFYGAGWAQGAVKVGGPRCGLLTDPAQRGDEVETSVCARLAAFVREHIPALRPTVVSSKWCMSTASPDEEFIVDRSQNGIVFAAGLCGRGFKYAPALGEALAEMVAGNRTYPEFGVQRFAAPAASGLDFQSL